MTTIQGTNCAEVLVAVGLPIDAIVHALMTQVGLTGAEATEAAISASDRRRDIDWVRHAYA